MSARYFLTIAREVRRYGFPYLRSRYWTATHLERLGPFEFSNSDREVHMLTCRRDVGEAKWALASWWAASGGMSRVYLHDDGSLTREDSIAFRSLFPGIKIVSRESADQIAALRLARFPRCAEYRSRHPLALKLFDCALIGDAESFLLFDSDVLFFSSVDEALRKASQRQPKGVNVFLEDYQESYSISVEEIGSILGRPYRARVNSGVALIYRESVGLDRIEELLVTHPEIEENLSWAEQTLYAILSGPEPGLLDHRCEVARSRGVEGLLLKHYVGPARGLLYVEGVSAVERTLRVMRRPEAGNV